MHAKEACKGRTNELFCASPANAFSMTIIPRDSAMPALHPFLSETEQAAVACSRPPHLTPVFQAAAFRSSHGKAMLQTLASAHHIVASARLIQILLRSSFRAQELSAQGLNNLVHAYAKLGVMPRRLAPACAHEVKHRLPCPSFTLQDLVTLLWSLCILEVRSPASALLRTVTGLALVKLLRHVSDLPKSSHHPGQILACIACRWG